MYTQHGQQQRANILKAANADYLAVLRPIVAKIPTTVVARVKNTGVGSDGGKFSKYSSGWSRVRSKNSLQTSNKDFWFDGNMWRTYKIVKEELTETGVTFTLASDGAKGHNGTHLVDIHSDREGKNILDITEDEWESLQKELGKAIEKYAFGFLGK